MAKEHFYANFILHDEALKINRSREQAAASESQMRHTLEVRRTWFTPMKMSTRIHTACGHGFFEF